MTVNRCGSSPSSSLRISKRAVSVESSVQLRPITRQLATDAFFPLENKQKQREIQCIWCSHSQNIKVLVFWCWDIRASHRKWRIVQETCRREYSPERCSGINVRPDFGGSVVLFHSLVIMNECLHDGNRQILIFGYVTFFFLLIYSLVLTSSHKLVLLKCWNSNRCVRTLASPTDQPCSDQLEHPERSCNWSTSTPRWTNRSNGDSLTCHSWRISSDSLKYFTLVKFWTRKWSCGTTTSTAKWNRKPFPLSDVSIRWWVCVTWRRQTSLCDHCALWWSD